MGVLISYHCFVDLMNFGSRMSLLHYSLLNCLVVVLFALVVYDNSIPMENVEERLEF